MVDQETAAQGLSALSVAVAEIMEESHDLAVTRIGEDEDPFIRIVSLQSAGQDIAALANAMGVLTRRSERRR